MGPCEVSNQLFAQKLDDKPRWTMIRHGMTNHRVYRMAIIQVGLRDAKKSGMVRFQGYNIAEWTDDFSTVDVAIGLIQRLRETMGAANFASAENKFATPATAIAVMAHHLNLKQL